MTMLKVVITDTTITAPTATITAITAALTIWSPFTRSGCFSTPSSLAQAMTEPESDTAPIRAPASVTISAVGP